jgi:hypothetical protein
MWPQVFHPVAVEPDAHLDPPTEACMMAHVLAALADQKAGGGAVLVDPTSDCTVTTASSVARELARIHLQQRACAPTTASFEHPLLTPVMLCIEGMAWRHQQLQVGRKKRPRDEATCVCGVATHTDVPQCPWRMEPSPEAIAALGCPIVTAPGTAPNPSTTELVGEGAYLCTGLDLYAVGEPSAMYSAAIDAKHLN